MTFANEQMEALAIEVCNNIEKVSDIRRWFAERRAKAASVWNGNTRGAYRALCTRCASAVRKVGCSPPPGVQ